MVLSGYQWLPVVLNGSQWFSMPWFSMVTSVSAGSTTPVDSATCTKSEVENIICAMKWIKLASIRMYPTEMLSHQFCKSQHTGIAFVGSVTHLRH